MRRGRPPYPDVLTPREWQVLELLRRGLTNEQIAEELSISRDGAKYHVSEIISKLGVSNRYEAAATEPASKRSRLSGLWPFAWMQRRSPVLTAGTLAGTGAVVVVVLGLAALALGLLAMSLRESDATGADQATIPAARATTTQSPALLTTATAKPPDCPVVADACRLASEFLPAVQAADGTALAKEVTPQQIDCANDPSTPDVVVRGARDALCQGRGSGNEVPAFELHNGKGPLYFMSNAEYADQLTQALEGFAADQGPPELVAVGCGAIAPDSTPGCDRALVTIYGAPDATSPLFFALTFTRASTADAWVMEKVWTPYPNAIVTPLVAGFSLGINTLQGITLVQLYPYDGL